VVEANRVSGAQQLVVDPVEAAHRLLGATLTARGVRATVVEVEAYGGVPDGPWPDAAAHSYRGLSGRNAVMFGPPGRQRLMGSALANVEWLGENCPEGNHKSTLAGALGDSYP
jgi:3-methyladenine DNA glycosylase Mpg